MARSINEINPKIDLTVRIFDTFYDYAEEVNVNEYDTVYSFFFQEKVYEVLIILSRHRSIRF